MWGKLRATASISHSQKKNLFSGQQVGSTDFNRGGGRWKSGMATKKWQVMKTHSRFMIFGAGKTFASRYFHLANFKFDDLLLLPPLAALLSACEWLCVCECVGELRACACLP